MQPKISTFCFATLFSLAAAPAVAADQWEEAASGAVAILPAPSESEGIVGGSLFCAEQKWGLLLRTVAVDAPALGTSATIGLDGKQVTVAAKATAGSIESELPAELLESLTAGSRFRFEMIGDTAKARAIFTLRNSGKVIQAIAPRCSQVNMSGYESVKLQDAGAAVDTATSLFAGELKLLKAATAGAKPIVTATQFELDAEKHLLFGALCGSVNYYGQSGCTLWGWARSGAEAEWKTVYESEGVHLYLDKTKARDGWRGIATLPMANGAEPSHWVWQDDAYVRDDPEMAVGSTGGVAPQAE